MSCTAASRSHSRQNGAGRGSARNAASRARHSGSTVVLPRSASSRANRVLSSASGTAPMAAVALHTHSKSHARIKECKKAIENASRDVLENTVYKYVRTFAHARWEHDEPVEIWQALLHRHTLLVAVLLLARRRRCSLIALQTRGQQPHDLFVGIARKLDDPPE